MVLEGVLAVVVVLAAIATAFQRFGWLPAGPVAQAAHDRADRAEAELAKANEELVLLRTRTDLSALIDVTARLVEAQATILEKLEHLNGGLKASAEAHAATAESLRTTGEAIKFLATRSEQEPS